MMKKSYILALDAGTTSNRAILFDRNAQMLAVAQQEFPQYYPQPSWVEQSATDIWESQYAVAREAIAKAGVPAEEIAGIGIANQRETTILWEKDTSKLVYRAIVWQCRRTAEWIEELKKEDCSIEGIVRSKTGLILDPYFSASKIEWILDYVDGLRERAENGEILFGTVESWLVWNLTKGALHITDVSNASRTCLFNIHDLAWDEELLALFHIPKAILPKVVSNSEIYGECDAELFGAPIPICGLAGDQQAALFGQQCVWTGDAKVTYGTGAFLLLNTGKHIVESENGLLSTVAWQLGADNDVAYALEGSIFTAGSAVQWLRDDVELIADAAETEKLAESVKDTEGCFLVPAFTGLGTPYWRADARGVLVGLTRAVKRAHIVRATLESMAYQVRDVLALMTDELQKDSDVESDVVRSNEKDTGNGYKNIAVNDVQEMGNGLSAMSDSALKVDGGATRNNFLLQFQADISNQTVIRPSNVESTALGAAFMAGLACGFWTPEELAGLNPQEREFVPKMTDEKRQALLKGWQQAVEQTLLPTEK